MTLDRHTSVYLTQDEFLCFRAGAAKEGITVSNYLRKCLGLPVRDTAAGRERAKRALEKYETCQQ